MFRPTMPLQFQTTIVLRVCAAVYFVLLLHHNSVVLLLDYYSISPRIEMTTLDPPTLQRSWLGPNNDIHINCAGSCCV